MSINLTDEIDVKTKKGKLGTAKQIFLEGDTQTVEKEIKDINSRHNDLISKHESLSSTVSQHANQIENNQSQITANKSAQDAKNASLEDNIKKLNTRDDQITETLNNIAATGGASVASTVTYNNATSNLVSANVQGAIDELQDIKIDKTSILQESGDAEDKVMSQKATTTAIADETTRAKAAEKAIIFDVSVNNNGAVFESLQAILSSSNLNTLIPASVRHGGMSIRFIQGSEQSSDNKYMQYRLMATSFSTTESDWQGVDDEPTAGSGNLVKSGGVYKKISQKVSKNEDGITVVSDDSDTFYVIDSVGHVITKIDKTGIYSPNINDISENLSSLSTDVTTLSTDVTTFANLVASIFNAEVENIFSDNSDNFLVVDKRGYIGLRVSNRGVEGVFLNTNTGGIKNDLRKQNNITPVIGNYGADNTVYKLSRLPNVFRIAFDFRLNDNINVIGTDKPFVRLVGASMKDVKPIHAVPTDLLVSRNGETYTAVSQVIGFNSGFNVCGTSFVRSPFANKPIVGDTAFSLWLKGNFNEESDFPTEQKVLERASWLSSHSTAKIVFSNDIFSVQGVSENAINVSIKNGNVYKSLGAFYDDLLSALGDYFVFKKLRLSASKTTADLLQFGELKLVSNYWQQTNKASTSLSYNYDSFPVSIPLAIDETLHTVEIIGADGNVWVSVDGQFTKYSDTLTEIYIGGTETESGLITCSNLEYDNGSLGDAIIDNNYGIISSRTPRVVGVMQHLIEDKYEGETLTQEYYSSVSRMLDIFQMLENRGYTILTLNDVCLWLSGRKKIPARSIFFLATTNPTYDQFLNNLLSRRIWTGASVPLIIGSILVNDISSAGGSDKLFKQVVSARAIGVDYITHLYDHDVYPDYKNSLILQQELYKLIRLCIDSGINTRMYSYGWSCKSVNYYNMLSLNGFIGAMGNGNPSISAGNKYNLGRVNISDVMSVNNLSKLLI